MGKRAGRGQQESVLELRVFGFSVGRAQCLTRIMTA
jgi:hypothetical protein